VAVRERQHLNTPIGVGAVLVPAGIGVAADAGPPNMSAAILMPDGDTIRQAQPFHVCGPGGTVGN
jgi:hypothetical protein